MSKIRYRTITPLFNFHFLDESYKYMKSGKYKDIDYDVLIRKYGNGTEEYDNILMIPDEYSRKSLVSLHIDEKYGATDYFLTCDLYYEVEDSSSMGGNTIETNDLSNAVIQSLRIISSAGLDTRYTYILRKPYSFSHYSYNERKCGAVSYGNCITISPLCFPHIFGPLTNDSSIFNRQDEQVFNNLIEFFLTEKSDTRLDRLISLVLNNFYYSFVVEDIKHSFLLLMIICDSLFKKEDEDANDSSKKISLLLSSSAQERKAINKAFNSADDSFYKIRNHIAHGDPELLNETVKNKYQSLYTFIQQIIVLFLTDLYYKLDKNEYYDSLSKYITEKYRNRTLL